MHSLINLFKAYCCSFNGLSYGNLIPLKLLNVVNYGKWIERLAAHQRRIFRLKQCY